jgi:alpha-glucosidase/alpha-D-xyloside xylohydrolase
LARVSDRTLEITVSPDEQSAAGGAKSSAGENPALIDYPRTILWSGSFARMPRRLQAGGMMLAVSHDPLTLTISRNNRPVQQIIFNTKDGSFSFRTQEAVFGLGENGVKLDRRGSLYPMKASYLKGPDGSVMPFPFLAGLDHWALFITSPEGSLHLRSRQGVFRPETPGKPTTFFVTAWDQPKDIFPELVLLMGKPAMPPLWALGYFQSHRTLAGPEEVLSVARTLREKELPCDGLIYLSTGYCPEGWNQGLGSFDFNPKSFPYPDTIFQKLHNMNFKVILHTTYPLRMPLLGLHGSSMSEPADGPLHIAEYWKRHRAAFLTGADGWWVDDGDELPPLARLARHRCYFEGPLQERPGLRPWSLHRTGSIGMARYGGWYWSGDTPASWKSLDAHVRVAVNATLGPSPFWGSDTGGFIPGPELTGELYVRWFQFAAFTPCFRSHGINWHLHLPWGWNTGEPGVKEAPPLPNVSELHNRDVEPICRKFLDLRYQLLPYNYTMTREAHDTGMPLMRPLWLYDPGDPDVVSHGDEYLWGSDLLIAPVVKKKATTRSLYLPKGIWYDWWSGERLRGGMMVERPVTLATIPILVRAGSIIPLDPIRQHTSQAVTDPTEICIYPGRDGTFTLYEDDGKTMDYLTQDGIRTRFLWNEASKNLVIEPLGITRPLASRRFMLRLMAGEKKVPVDYSGTRIQVPLH